MYVGKKVTRVDAYDKVIGRTKYTDDLCDKSAYIARILHSTIANGHVLSLSLLAPALPAADPRRMARGARLFADDLHRRGHALPEGHVPHRRTARSDFEYV